MSPGLKLGIPLSDREDHPRLNDREAPLWQRRSFLGATLALVSLSVVLLVLVWRDLATTSEMSARTAALTLKLETERSLTIELRAKMETLFEELRAAIEREAELDTAISQIGSERDRLKSELASATDQRASIEAERRALSEDLTQFQALVVQQRATIEQKASEIVRLSNRVSEIERSEPSVVVAEEPTDTITDKPSDSVVEMPSSQVARWYLESDISRREPPIAALEDPASNRAGELETSEALDSVTELPSDPLADEDLPPVFPRRKPQIAALEDPVANLAGELETSEASDRNTDLPPGPVAGGDLVLKLPRRKPQIAAREDPIEDRPNELERAEPSEIVTDEPSGPVASEALTQESLQNRPQLASLEDPVATPTSELERPEPSDTANVEPPGPAAGEDLTRETPQDRPQIASREGPRGPAEFLEDLSGKFMQIYQSSGVGSGERQRLLRDLLHESVDLSKMSKSILGSQWQRADAGERARYVALVEGYLFKPLIRALEGEGVRGMRIVNTGPANESGTLVTTRLETLSGKAHTLGWRIQERDNAFKAVDLRAQGVSLFNVYESELESYAARNGVIALLETLESRDQVIQGAAKRVPGNP